MTSCKQQNKSNYKYSEKESGGFLNEIVRNVKFSIGDFTEIKKQPTDELYLYTRYPISKKGLEWYNKNRGTIINKNTYIWGFTTYVCKDYELINKKNEKLQFVDNGRTIYLQEYSLWNYDNILCQNLGAKINLDKKYKKLKGHITIKFEMPDKVNKEIKIPVNTTIYDKTLNETNTN